MERCEGCIFSLGDGGGVSSSCSIVLKPSLTGGSKEHHDDALATPTYNIYTTILRFLIRISCQLIPFYHCPHILD